jgi:hypothetical protein
MGFSGSSQRSPIALQRRCSTQVFEPAQSASVFAMQLVAVTWSPPAREQSPSSLQRADRRQSSSLVPWQSPPWAVHMPLTRQPRDCWQSSSRSAKHSFVVGSRVQRPAMRQMVRHLGATSARTGGRLVARGAVTRGAVGSAGSVEAGVTGLPRSPHSQPPSPIATTSHHCFVGRTPGACDDAAAKASGEPRRRQPQKKPSSKPAQSFMHSPQKVQTIACSSICAPPGFCAAQLWKHWDKVPPPQPLMQSMTAVHPGD